MTNEEIRSLRETLRDLDGEIVRLLNARAEVALAIGRIKNDQGLDIYDPSQEARVYNRVREANFGPLPEHHLRNIFREIISTSRSQVYISNGRRPSPRRRVCNSDACS